VSTDNLNLEDLNPTDEERALGSYDAIVAHREAEKATMVAKTLDVKPEAPTLPVIQGKTIGSILTTLTDAGHAGTTRARAERLAEVRAEVQPLLTEARSLETRHGMLRAKHLARVEEVAGADWSAISAAAASPAYLKLVEVGGRKQNVNVAQRAVHRLRTAAVEARAVLSSSMGDNEQGRDIDPTSLSRAAAAVENALAGGDIDFAPGVLRQSFKRGVSHLRVWIERAQRLVDGTEVAVQRFDEAVEATREIMVGLVVAEAPPRPPASRLPVMEDTRPTLGGTSYQDFEPREVMRDPEPPKDASPVTFVGPNKEGIRVGRMITDKNGKGKIAGITTKGA
jgi:hypothetical protein